MAMTTTALVAKMKQLAGGNTTTQQDQQMEEFAQEIINIVKSATLNYTAGLVSAAPGQPVTGSMAAVTIT